MDNNVQVSSMSRYLKQHHSQLPSVPYTLQHIDILQEGVKYESVLEWRRNVEAFLVLFQGLIAEGLLSSESKVLCLGAKNGQEVLVLKEIGVSDAVGSDPVASPPLVIEGDMHRQSFEDNTFDFEFSSVLNLL